jgi:hypothetical protein
MRRVFPWLLLAATAHADGITVTATTTPAGGPYAPRNVVAVWVQDSAGTFIKTIQRWSAGRTQYLLAWRALAAQNDVDAVSGATRPNHNTPLSITWDLKDRAGNVVPPGTYTIRMEVADSDATSTAQNNEGTFTFVRSAAPQVQTGLTNGGFNSVTIDFEPSTCGNNVVESGETCDPVSSCPTTCPASNNACTPNVLTGSAAGCTAACVTQSITDCVSGDGCCPASCTSATDSDCGAGSGSDPGTGSNPAQPADVTGGCTTGGGSWLACAALAALALVRRRRRA